MSQLDPERQEYDRQCDEATKHRSRVFYSRATKVPGNEVEVVIFGAGCILKDISRPMESTLVLYAEETSQGVT